MVAQPRRGFQPGFKYYVPAMQYASDLSLGFPTLFYLGTPAAASATGLKSGIDADAVAGTQEAISWEADSPYGRGLVLTPSGDPGNSFAIDVYGFDYLEQPMVERFTGGNGSTSAINGKKAFWRVTHTEVVTAASNAVTANLGTTKVLGLPYKGQVEWAKEAGAYVTLSSQATAPVETDPQTATTGDPRGTYTGATYNGTNEIYVGLRGDPSVNAAGNGGLHGIQHYHP